MTVREKLLFAVKVGKSRIAGRGAFASVAIPARRKLGTLGGEIISFNELKKRLRDKQKVYNVVEFDNENIAIDATNKSTTLRFINHSCNPNTYMRRAYRRVEFYALRAIRAGEELTCDYGETHHNGQLACQCGAQNCRGFI